MNHETTEWFLMRIENALDAGDEKQALIWMRDFLDWRKYMKRSFSTAGSIMYVEPKESKWDQFKRSYL